MSNHWMAQPCGKSRPPAQKSAQPASLQRYILSANDVLDPYGVRRPKAPLLQSQLRRPEHPFDVVRAHPANRPTNAIAGKAYLIDPSTRPRAYSKLKSLLTAVTSMLYSQRCTKLRPGSADIWSAFFISAPPPPSSRSCRGAARCAPAFPDVSQLPAGNQNANKIRTAGLP